MFIFRNVRSSKHTMITLLSASLLAVCWFLSSGIVDAASYSDEALNENNFGYRQPSYSTLSEAIQLRKEREDVVRKEIEAGTASAEDQLELGKVLNDSGYTRAAVERFSKAIEADPQFAEAYFRRAGAYSYLGHLEQAIADLDKCLELVPDNTECLSKRAFIQYVLGEEDMAFKAFDRILTRHPNHVATLNRRGLIYYDKKDYVNAMNDFEAAIAIDPDYPYAWRNGARTLLFRGGMMMRSKEDSNRAIEMLTKAIRLDPVQAQSYCYRAMAYTWLYKDAEALADLQMATKAEPGYDWSYFLLGKHAVIKKNSKETILQLTKAIDLDCNQAKTSAAYSWRAEAYEALGFYSRAKRDKQMIEAIDSVGRLRKEFGPGWKTARPDNSPVTCLEALLLVGVTTRDYAKVKIALLEGADPNLKISSRMAGQRTQYIGRTMLHIACDLDESPIAHLLLSHGALRTEKDADGNTPLALLKTNFDSTAFTGMTRVVREVRKRHGLPQRSDDENLKIYINFLLYVGSETHLKMAESAARTSEQGLREDMLGAMDSAHLSAITGMARSDDNGKPRYLAQILAKEYQRHESMRQWLQQQQARQKILAYPMIEANVDTAIWFAEIAFGRESQICKNATRRGRAVLQRYR